jgi:tetratricopeptide (TPR) repeat protein
MEFSMLQFVQVRYRNGREGLVDDITLEELIESKRISEFYRASEDRWVSVYTGPVRKPDEPNKARLYRRKSDWEGTGEEETEEEAREEKRSGLFGNFFKRRREPPPAKTLSAEEWFKQGFVTLHTTDDSEAAVRAFAHCIRLDPTHERAYVNRGLAYERLGNVQQAIEDFTRAITIDAGDAKLYYLRGLALRRLGVDAEALADLRKAADLRYRPAYDFLKSMGISIM